MGESHVHHHLYGRGEIRETRYKGLELRVEFADGIARWIRAEDLLEAPTPHSPTRTTSIKRTETPGEEFKSRRMAEAFRMGTVPYDTLDEFTFGREKEICFLGNWLEDPSQSTLIVLGEYGTGKSHLLHYAHGHALRSRFAVCHMAVDPLESPFSRPKRVYARLMSTFKYPTSPEGGTGSLRDFIQTCVEKGAFHDHRYFGVPARKFWDESWWEWISGAQLSSYPWKAQVKAFMSKVPGLYDYSSTANIYCHLVSSLGWAASEVMGLKGLLLTFDEAEAVDLYEHSYQPKQSRNFLSSLIRVAENAPLLSGSPHSTGLRYSKTGKGPTVPFLYKQPSSLKLVFAFTPGYTLSTLPELQSPPLMKLQSLSDSDLENVHKELCRIYARAYGFEDHQTEADFVREAIGSQESGRTRRFVKATIEALDIARLDNYPITAEACADDSNSIHNVPRLLPHAWAPFFAPFGSLKPPQIEAIPKIIAGKNVVISAPTASGKTEAVVAPVAQRMVSEQWSGLSVVYITPTRALGNDMLTRIQGSLREMGITAFLKHGDTPPIPRTKIPNFLITTPESLDSTLCRRTEILKDLRTLILDEIHLLDNTYRGDQLRILINRLRKVAQDSDFAVHILSATLDDPLRMASRYVSSSLHVNVHGHRTIELMNAGSLQEVHDIARQKRFKKILCFCNTPDEAELIAREMRKLWHPYPVFAHHGSLAVSLRRESERVMREESVAVCVATSTLEVGIDIGDIDLVLLAELPWSESSLVQRIGRGKRRGDVINVMVLSGLDGSEIALVRHLLEEPDDVEMPESRYEPDISVAVQQIFSWLFQRKRAVPEEEFLDLLRPLGTPEDLKLIRDHLKREGWIETRRAGWMGKSSLMDFAEKGNIHSNIPSNNTLRVVNVESGSAIGEIRRPVEEFFSIGNRVWQTLWADDKVAKVRPASGIHSPAKFKKSRDIGAFFFFLPEELRNWPGSELDGHS